jgi:hypothetical protein
MAQFGNVACWSEAFMKTGDVEDDGNMELSSIFKGKHYG